MHYYDYLKEFADFKGMTANLFTEISTSKDKNFSCVDLIDTPGLVDGDMQAGGMSWLACSTAANAAGADTEARAADSHQAVRMHIASVTAGSSAGATAPDGDRWLGR